MAKIMEINKSIKLEAIIELNTQTKIKVSIVNNSLVLHQGNNTIRIDKYESKPFCDSILELLKESEL